MPDRTPAPAPDASLEAASAALRERYGQVVHDTRLAVEAERAAAEGRERFHLGGWGDRTPEQRALDIAIADAVIREWDADNAVLWGVPCPGCARTLDRAYGETVRAEEAEAVVAKLRSILLEGGQDDKTARRRAMVILCGEEARR